MNDDSAASDPHGTSMPFVARHDVQGIRLLPRHWAWLETQPRSASASLRLLVEKAHQDTDGRYRAARAKETCYLYMRDMAGDRAGFEEAVRALFADDIAGLQQQMAAWPMDVQTHIGDLLGPAWTSALRAGVP